MDEDIRFTHLDLNLIKSLPSELRDELIYLEDVIPDDIMSTIYFHDSIYKKKRHDFLNYRPDLLRKMYKARGKRKQLMKNNHKYTVETNEMINFIRKYPQFKQLITGVEFKDENRDTVKVVPIDQYLAEN